LSNKIYDHLIIGSGIAGLYYAILAAAKGTVLLISKDELNISNTYYAQGGIASVENDNDSFEKHIEDTRKAGDELCNPQAVEMIVHEGPEVIRDLIDFGMNFTKDDTSDRFSLHREGGHSEHRIFHYEDVTGKEVVRTLVEKAKGIANLEIRTRCMAIDLLTEHQKDNQLHNTTKVTCFGAYALDLETNQVDKILAKSTILATGGAGQVYLHTSNPAVATGDGLAMAYRARATITNLEFFQFHPTTLYSTEESENAFLITEAVRGFGGILRNRKLEEFMINYHPLKSLAPRDVVARAIDNEMKKHGDNFVYLDIRDFPASKIIKAFPNIYRHCLEKGIDITKDLIPVVPAAHYQCGGVQTDLKGQTDVNGLYAVGEVAHTGVHGANRLASNSLLEALVFARKAVESANSYNTENSFDFTGIKEWSHGNAVSPQEKVVITYLKNMINSLMSNFVGIVRSDERLEFALKTIDLIQKQVRSYYKKTYISRELLELRNINEVAGMIIRFALFRKESRGLHYNIDHPHKDNEHWLKNSTLKSSGKGSSIVTENIEKL